MLRENNIEWVTAVSDTVISNGLLLATTLLLLNMIKYYRPQSGNYLYLLVWCLAISGLWSAVVKFGLGYVFRNDLNYSLFLEHSMNSRFTIALLICACASLLGILWYRQLDEQKKELRKQQTENALREAELHSLRYQFQPHFLFNSLNSIHALVGSNPTEAREMIGLLSDFMRGTIKRDDGEKVRFGEELRQLELYLQIEKVRFGHRLVTLVNIDESCAKTLMPPMTLQPLVENSIKFGLYGLTGEVQIAITAHCEENMLVISVGNPFDPGSVAKGKGTGFGLGSLQRRLYLLYGRNDLLTVSKENNYFTTTVKIPQYDQSSPGG